MTTRTYTGPDGFAASITANPDGTFDLATNLPSHFGGHGGPDNCSCGALEIAEAELLLRCPTAALQSEA